MLALLVAIGAVMAQGPSPTLHYRVEVQSVAHIDATAPGEGGQKQTTTTSALLSLTLRDTAGGRVAHIVVDSVVFDAGTATSFLPVEVLADAKGSFFHLFIIDGVAVPSAVPSKRTLSTMQIAGAVDLLFTGVPDTLKPGASWQADSLAPVTWIVGPSSEGTGTLQGRIALTSVAGSDVVLRMQTTGTASVTGTAKGPSISATSTTQSVTTTKLDGRSVAIKVSTTTRLDRLP